MSTKVKLLNVRLFFPDLFEAVEFKPGDGKPRFNATFGIPKTDKAQLALIEAAVQAEATEGWKAKGAAQVTAMRGNSNKFCLSDGDAKTYEGAEGLMLLSAHRKKDAGRPYVIDRQKNPLTAEDGKIYSGCYVNCTVEIWPQVKGEGAPGMRCGLLGVQFSKDGDAFSGASKASPEDFDDLGEGTEDEDLA